MNEDDTSTDHLCRLLKAREVAKHEKMQNITTEKFVIRKLMLDLSYCGGLMIKFKVSVVP